MGTCVREWHGNHINKEAEETSPPLCCVRGVGWGGGEGRDGRGRDIARAAGGGVRVVRAWGGSQPLFLPKTAWVGWGGERGGAMQQRSQVGPRGPLKSCACHAVCHARATWRGEQQQAKGQGQEVLAV